MFYIVTLSDYLYYYITNLQKSQKTYYDSIDL